MVDCNYQVVNIDEQSCVTHSDHKTPWKYFFRQVILASALWTLYFTCGLCVGTPTVLIPQFNKQSNATFIDEEMTSWLYSSFGFAAIPWVIVVPIFSTYVGRKPPYLISCASILAAFIILYFSTTPYHILISEIVQGFAHANNVTITVLIVSEYSDPKYRGIFLTIKSASFFWGIWAANAIGTFFHWRYIAIAGLFCSVYSFVGVFYPESPHWLASKGKYEKSKSAFRWLQGTNEKSEQELQNIIKSQTEQRKFSLERRNESRCWSRFNQMLSTRQFYLPLGLSLVMGCQYHFSGKLICSTFAVDMMKRMTRDESSAYTGMLILDGVTVIGMYAGSFVTKILKRRTLYMTSSFIGVAFLFMLALNLYLVKLGIIQENNTVTILLLMVYSVAISCGPMIMSMTVTGEIIPVRYQALSYSILATLFSTLLTVLLKTSPQIFAELEMHGSFLLYGITAGVCTIVLYFYLPETKDKTLSEIEEYFKDHKERGDLHPDTHIFFSIRRRFFNN